MGIYDIRRVAAMTVVLHCGALVFVSGAQEKRVKVGYFIFGANLGNLPVSQDERTECAFAHAMENFPREEHVYFASGKTAPGVEAYYIRDKLLKLYGENGQPHPTILLEDEALFTVDNVLKTLTMINNVSDLDHVYMVSSDYHLERAAACYSAFSELGLCRYPFYQRHMAKEERCRPKKGSVLMHKIRADHQPITLTKNPIVGKYADWEKEAVDRRKILHKRDEIYLNGEIPADRQSCLCGNDHSTNEEQIRCPERDRSNSRIFAHYINEMKKRGLTSLNDLGDEDVLMNSSHMQ